MEPKCVGRTGEPLQVNKFKFIVMPRSMQIMMKVWISDSQPKSTGKGLFSPIQTLCNSS